MCKFILTLLLLLYTANLSFAAGHVENFNYQNQTTPITPTTPGIISPVVTIDSYHFILRFTTAEQNALMVSNPSWGILIAAIKVVDVADPTLISYLQTAVTDGILTQARVTQILNLSIPSP